MKAGPLRYKVVVQRKSVSKDSLGAETITWTTYATVWAQVQPLRGREYIDLRAAQAEITTRIRMRYLSGLDTTMQIVFGSQTFAIVEIIDENSRNRMLEVMCRAHTVAA